MTDHKCSSCGHTFRAKDGLPEKGGECPKCGSALDMPHCNNGTEEEGLDEYQNLRSQREVSAESWGDPHGISILDLQNAYEKFARRQAKWKQSVWFCASALVMGLAMAPFFRPSWTSPLRTGAWGAVAALMALLTDLLWRRLLPSLSLRRLAREEGLSRREVYEVAARELRFGGKGPKWEFLALLDSAMAAKGREDEQRAIERQKERAAQTRSVSVTFSLARSLVPKLNAIRWRYTLREALCGAIALVFFIAASHVVGEGTSQVAGEESGPSDGEGAALMIFCILVSMVCSVVLYHSAAHMARKWLRTRLERLAGEHNLQVTALYDVAVFFYSRWSVSPFWSFVETIDFERATVDRAAAKNGIPPMSHLALGAGTQDMPSGGEQAPTGGQPSFRGGRQALAGLTIACQQCGQVYALGSDAVAVTTEAIRAKFAAVTILTAPGARQSNREDPDLVGPADYATASDLASYGGEVATIAAEVAAGRERWWKCSKCGEVQRYEPSLGGRRSEPKTGRPQLPEGERTTRSHMEGAAGTEGSRRQRTTRSPEVAKKAPKPVSKAPEAPPLRLEGEARAPDSPSEVADPTHGWEIRLASGEPSEPMTFETILKLAHGNRMDPGTILRGPLTRGVWRQAKHTPRLCRLFGTCYYCGDPLPPGANACPSCATDPDQPK